MNSLKLLDMFLGGQLDGKLSGNDAKAADQTGFLQILLESDGLRDSGLTAEQLQAWLAQGGGESLPPGGEELPLAVDEPETELPAAALSSALLAAAEPEGEAEGEVAGRQLAARLALLDQLELRKPAREPETPSPQRVTGDMPSPLQSVNIAEPPSRPGVPTFTVGTPMDQNGWGQALGERVVLLASQDVREARIQLNPRELGPVDVTITLRDDKASVMFQAQHAVTREALEAELPRLRSMLQEQGFEQLDVNVGRDDGREFAGNHEGGSGDADAHAGDETRADALQDAARQPLERRLVDHYA